MTNVNPPLRGRARLTFWAHLFKALTRQHHTELIPILRPVLPEDGIVFDVGAHAGQMAKLFAIMAPQGHVYAFEPGAYALSILGPMVRLKGRGRISIDPIAFGAKPGTLTLSTPIKKSGSLGFGLSHLGQGGEGDNVYRHDVAVETVDGYVAAKGLERLDLIKADIEGWEMQLLLGATETLAKLRPVVFLEAVDFYLARAGDSRTGLWTFMRERGYRPHRLEPGLPAFEPEADGDVVWVPAEKPL
jgi:FkbM family methyltransferase